MALLHLPTKIVQRTNNAIRSVLDQMLNLPRPAGKSHISLSVGDPTTFGNYTVPATLISSLHSRAEAAASGMSPELCGYGHSCGIPAAREAVAKHLSPSRAGALDPKDVILTSGCSHALDMAFSALACPTEGTSVLLPQPGFPLYETLCASRGIKYKYYNLLPEKNWEIDIADLSSKIEPHTAAILVNSPSNPTGGVFSKNHISDILQVAEAHKVPLISDEIYRHMAFSGSEFHSFASMPSACPILEVGGIAKRFMVPGWRLGWVAIHNGKNAFDEMPEWLFRLTTLILGPNTFVQGLLPSLLNETPSDYFEDALRRLEQAAHIAVDQLSGVPGLRTEMPQGSMYLMVRVDCDLLGLEDDVAFCRQLMTEENVFVLPGTIFGAPNFVRLITTAPDEIMREATGRIANFCRKRT